MLTYQQDVILAGLRQRKVARSLLPDRTEGCGASRNSSFGTSLEKPGEAFPGTPTGHRLPLREDAQRGRVPHCTVPFRCDSTPTQKEGRPRSAAVPLPSVIDRSEIGYAGRPVSTGPCLRQVTLHVFRAVAVKQVLSKHYAPFLLC